MVFEKFIRYAGLAVGLKPSAMGCEARLRGLERMMYSKTITPGVTHAPGSEGVPPSSRLRGQAARAPRRNVNIYDEPR